MEQDLIRQGEMLRQHGEMLSEIRDDIKELKQTITDSNIRMMRQDVSIDELKKSACPGPGTCMSLLPRVVALEENASQIKTSWKVVGTLAAFLVGVASFIWMVGEIIKLIFTHDKTTVQ